MTAMAWTFAPPSHAYDRRTHQNLSLAAFNVSNITPALAAYGIRPDQAIRQRSLASPFERHTPQEWVTLGGSAEDVPFWRALNHFYDPTRGVGLTLGIPLGLPAPDWALEDTRDLDGQSHSYRDARAALYDGLTLPSPTDRERELGHMFYALGHVIHMLQDMAQPQHTRGDAHLPLGASASLIEAYVEQNIDRFLLAQSSQPDLPPVNRARDLWVTEKRTGLGLAEFSNAHFVSAGTNFTELRQGATAESFPAGPSLDLADFNSDALACRDGAPAPGGDRAPLTFYANAFADPVTGNKLRNDRMTTYSIFDQDLQARGFRLVFALNCFNIDTAADLLLPRAVAYSAALLQYFFRGRLDFAHGVDLGGGGLLGIANRTPEPLHGRFELYAETPGGVRRPLGAWGPLTIQATGSSAPLPVTRLPYETGLTASCLLVFRGQLGDEPDGIAAEFKSGSFSCPTGDPPFVDCPISVCWD